MTLTLREANGQQFVEGAPGAAIVARAADAALLIEACFEHGASGLLLYPENLSGRFFDLSSGEAGEILQKLRNYNIRLAIVRPAGLQLSRRFEELLVDESRGRHFHVAHGRQAAVDWLTREA